MPTTDVGKRRRREAYAELAQTLRLVVESGRSAPGLEEYNLRMLAFAEKKARA